MKCLLFICLFFGAISTSFAGIERLEGLFKKNIFKAPMFSETITTVKATTYTTKTKVNFEAFSELAEIEKANIYDQFSDISSEVALAALGNTVLIHGGFNNKYAIEALIGIIKSDSKKEVAGQLPDFGTYYHLRVKSEQAEPYGYDLFLIADGLLDMENGKVVVLKVYYSYY